MFQVYPSFWGPPLQPLGFTQGRNVCYPIGPLRSNFVCEDCQSFGPINDGWWPGILDLHALRRFTTRLARRGGEGWEGRGVVDELYNMKENCFWPPKNQVIYRHPFSGASFRC